MWSDIIVIADILISRHKIEQMNSMCPADMTLQTEDKRWKVYDGISPLPVGERSRLKITSEEGVRGVVCEREKDSRCER